MDKRKLFRRLTDVLLVLQILDLALTYYTKRKRKG